ncbi:hypothetical protein BKA82DRAFT_857564 [Pisolithus tinctorius]|uniref:Uncharacterized protein n=1 Tax=Pisolithus tinctorius Marx 270 TaxID=870435 RepID=A0A0C3NB82_PISTI|nr:hypothetical protein BKA82DRAFT_857564 [Pisolithus tinctorius]KIN98349.1 hypothetical protein M404DRAFT_857564 [Pisolithus tinctorius Marx 270]
MPALPKDVTLFGKFLTLQSMAEHAIGCLLVAEHSYFLMQHEHHLWQEVLSLAVEEYNSSNMQTTISEAVKAAFHDHDHDIHGLCEAIIKIIIKYRMSNKLLMEPEGQ